MVVDFLTLPDELQSFANNLLSELRRRGYRPRAEPNILELPATPTIVAVRGHETHYILLRQKIALNEVQQWHRYCCSCMADTRLTVFHPDIQFPRSHIAFLREKGIGLATLEPDGLRYECEARDLAFHAQAPDRGQMKPRVRELLGEALDRFERGDWRPAFEDACGILEEESRSYMLKNIKIGRIKYQSGGKIKVPTVKQVKRMPMGALKDIFCALVSQNQIEANLCSALTTLNPDRVRRAHKRQSRRTENALRRRVGPHFWLINNALSLLV